MTAVPRIVANGLELAYLEAGPEDGPLVVLCHGFPDTAHTWSDVILRLAARGFRAVAPFMRGYAPSSIPKDGDYQLLTLAHDVLALIAALGREQAILVGHDWGAYACYGATNLAPERVTRLITVAIPHPRAIRPRHFTPGRLYRGRHFFALRSKRAAEQLHANDFAGVESIYRRWSPTWRLPPEELSAIKECFAAPGSLDAALGYYRALPILGPPAQLLERISVPSLTVFGLDDGVADAKLFEIAREGFAAPHELVALKNAGHFVHREQPELFAQALLRFVDRKGSD